MGQKSVKANSGRSHGKDVKAGEEAVPPVILRWQDLPEDDPDRGMIIASREDRMGVPPENENENEKPRGKGKKEAGPPLANYIRIYEFNLPCKMCPNPDWHRTFRCPNLTPGLKERLKEARRKCGTARAFLLKTVVVISVSRKTIGLQHATTGLSTRGVQKLDLMLN